jgi:uncharacterized protein YegP (UPF0339 family)
MDGNSDNGEPASSAAGPERDKGAIDTAASARRRLDRRVGPTSFQTLRGEAPMAHKFVIKKNKAGEFVAYFTYNSETIFWTEGYASKASAKNAIESIKKNGPDAEIDDQTD